MAEYSKEEIKKIEEKWRNEWAKRDVYKVSNDSPKPKYYVLDMFPYPSGAGLHVGHPLGYIASDIVARFKRIKGFNVLHPMGFDAFGLPAEQYALEHGVHPAKSTQDNIENFKRQLGKIGFCYDWSREVQTCDPQYYKWTQWIFLQIFDSWFNRKTEKAERISVLVALFEKEGNANHPVPNSKFQISNFTSVEWKAFDEKTQQEILMQYRLAYLAYTDVNWCEALGTVLANDEVINGVSYRGGFPVVKKQMRQWSLRITEYAERLLTGLDQIDFSESMKEIQRNWIGKSVGAMIEFSLTPNPSPGERGANSELGLKGYETSNKNYWDILKQFSKDNRKNQTEEEDALWQSARNNKLGFKIRRQHAIGTFIADFVCLDKRLVIEVDGEYHLNNKEYDDARTEFLKDEGFDVIRFTNDEVINNLQTVLVKIKSTLESRVSIRSTSPSPAEKGPGDEAITVFTTRPDTIFGVDFMVIAPEHELVKKITTAEQQSEIDAYLKYVESRSEVDRMAEVKKITGAFTGAYCFNPFNGKQIPVWISEYVLAGYGTGAIMAVPCGDERDFKFARHFNLPITNIIGSHFTGTEANPTKEAVLENSDFLNGMVMTDAMEVVIQKLEEMGIGKRQVNYKMRDAGWSRQRYWGEPFPVVFKDDLPYAMDESELPLELPPSNNFKPSGNGEGPLANLHDWINFAPSQKHDSNTMPTHAGAAWYFLRYMDPHNKTAFADKKALEYWNQVDVYIGGSEHAVAHLLYSRLWTKILHDLGYLNFDEPFKKLINQGKITGVSQYLKNVRPNASWMNDHPFSEKLRLHVFKNNSKIEQIDVNINVPGHERYVTQNSTLTFQYEDLKSGEMIPSEVREGYAKFKFSISDSGNSFLDVERWIEEEPEYKLSYLFNDHGFWHNENWHHFADSRDQTDQRIEMRPAIEKMSKSYLNVVTPDETVDNYGADTLRLYEMFLGPLEQSKPWSTQGIDGVFKFLRRFWNLFHNGENFSVSDAEPTRPELKVLHKTLKKIEQDIENFSFNTCVSEFMICCNELSSRKCNKRAILEPLTIALSPFAPHLAEELWEKLGHADSILNASFPTFDEQYLKENAFDYPISINGKVRLTMNMALDLSKEDIEKQVLASEAVAKWTEGKAPKKMIVVPGKIVNVVM